MPNNTLSIIIPVYNEEKYINQVFARVARSNTLGLTKEIIFVDDGSKDNSIVNIRHQIAKFKSSSQKTSTKIKLISNKINGGKGCAIKQGIKNSTGDIVLIQDADLEYNPTDYPTLLEPFIKLNADVVYGSRFVSNRPRRILYFWHYVANIILTTFSNMLSNLNLSDIETGYKLFKGEIIRKIAVKLKSKRFGFEPEITARIAKIPNINIYEVGISYQGRTYEEGKKIGLKDGILAVWEIIRFNLLEG